MHLAAEFMARMELLKRLATNDNTWGDAEFICTNIATIELTYTLAIFTRDEGVP